MKDGMGWSRMGYNGWDGKKALGFCSQMSLGTAAYTVFLFLCDVSNSQGQVQDPDVLQSRDLHCPTLADYAAP